MTDEELATELENVVTEINWAREINRDARPYSERLDVTLTGAINHIRNVTDAIPGWLVELEAWRALGREISGMGADGYCESCGHSVGGLRRHADNCLWVQAQALLELRGK